MFRGERHKTFETKLKILHSGLRVLSEYISTKKYILVEDSYGVCKVSPATLLRGHTPSVLSAVDKTAYSLARIKEVHGNAYTYPNYKYENTRSIIYVLCPTHGGTSKRYQNLIEGEGCQSCSLTSRSSLHKTFPEQLKVILPKLELIGSCTISKKHVLVKDSYGICRSLPHNLLKGQMPTIRSAVDKTSYWVNRAREVHGALYDYSLVRYKGNKRDITILCPFHGEFLQAPCNHIAGKGCAICGEISSLVGYHGSTNDIFEARKVPSGIYVLLLSKGGETFWKIGISKNPKNRLSVLKGKSGHKVKKLHYQEMSLFDAITLEQLLLKKYKHLQHTPAHTFEGSTECFSINPLENFEEFKHL